MKKYFLFGEKAVNARYFLKDGESLADKLGKISFGVYIWDEFSTPGEILLEYDGWSDFAEISEEEYEELLSIVQ